MHCAHNMVILQLCDQEDFHCAKKNPLIFNYAQHHLSCTRNKPCLSRMREISPTREHIAPKIKLYFLTVLHLDFIFHKSKSKSTTNKKFNKICHMSFTMVLYEPTFKVILQPTSSRKIYISKPIMLINNKTESP